MSKNNVITPVCAKWRVPSDAARNVDQLSFTSRDAKGIMRWWDVTPPKTDYWGPHEALGRAYAYEFLDLVHSSDKPKKLYKHTFGFIASEIVRRGHTTSEGLYFGFFEVISEYLVTGKVVR